MKHVYYNENDPYAAQWLRNLIAAGHIADGDVDERSIVDVRGDDLGGYIQCHFFAGIGGWSLACRLAGIPDDEPIWTGSCPCQPFSGAGKRRGTNDERHLWPEFHRLIAECAPSVVAGEQVASRDGREWLTGVRADLEELGYGVGAADLCAAGVGAPHIRQRLYWVANSDRARRGIGEKCHSEPQEPPALQFRHGPYGRGDNRGLDYALGVGWGEGRNNYAQYDGVVSSPARWVGDANDPRPQGWGDGPEGGRRADQWVAGSTGQPGFWSRYAVVHCADGKARRFEPGSFPLAHGVSGRVGRLRGYGNAIVPQVAATFLAAAYDVLNEFDRLSP